MRVRAPLFEYPTLQALADEAATTPSRASEDAPTLGLGWTFHVVPFQCSTRVRYVVPLEERPTAQALEAEMTATPFSALLLPTFGLGRTRHAVPFQCSMSVRARLLRDPTAQAL